MTITLYLEVNGIRKDKKECDYMIRHQIAKQWHRMYPGKKVTVYYTLESKMNYEPKRERPADSGGTIRPKTA